jgi:hypothetical protein
VGVSANDHSGDPLRTAFQKTNLAITQVNTNTTNIALKLSKTDTTAMLGHYVRTSAGIVQAKISHLSDSLLARYTKTQANTKLNLKVNIVDTAAMLSKYVRTAGSENLSDIAPLLVDTIPLVTFGAGAGLIADTALFNNGVLIGCFYNDGSDTLVITKLMGILKEGTGTETIAVQISWHSTMLSGSAVSLNSSPLAITSITTGTADVSFANAKIPPKKFVWGILSGASKDNKPTFLNVTLSGYKIPTY